MKLSGLVQSDACVAERQMLPAQVRMLPAQVRMRNFTETIWKLDGKRR